MAKLLIFLSLALFIVGFPTASLAEETMADTVYQFSPIQITSEKTMIYLDNVSSSVTVLSDQQIQTSGAKNLGDLLKPVTGVYVSDYGSSGSRKTVSVRGSAADQVLVLIDGKKINPVQSGTADLNQIPMENIQSVEILRSGGSVFWGAESIGGIINIITKDGRGIGDEFWIQAEYGSFHTQSISGQIAGKKHDIDYLLTAKYHSTEGTFTFKENWRPSSRSQQNNDVQRINISTKLGWTFAHRHNGRAEFYLDKGQTDGGVPGTIEFPTPNAEKEDDYISASLALSAHDFIPILKDDSAEVHLYQNRMENHYVNPETPFSFEGTHVNRASGFQANFHTSTLQIGYDLRKDELESDIHQSGQEKTEHHERTKNGVFALADWEFPGESGKLKLGLRYDDFSDIDGIWTYEAGFNYKFHERFILRSNLARAYKMPSFNDLFWTSTSFALGNSNLAPEKSINVDLGIIVYPVRKARFEITYFRKDIADLIQWNSGAGGVWRPINIDRVLINGVENELYLPLMLDNDFLLEATANYTFLSALDKSGSHATENKQLIRRPEHQANISVSANYKHLLRFQTGWRYVGQRYITAANTKSLPAYDVTDLNLKLYMNENWEAGLKVKNLFDEKFVDVFDFPVPGRKIMANLKFTW